MVALASAAALPGCISSPPRYTYEVDIRNALPSPVQLELLMMESGTANKLRSDLAPGGRFTHAFTAFGRGDYFEARARPLPALDGDPFFARELTRDRTRLDITSEGGRLVFGPREPIDATPPLP